MSFFSIETSTASLVWAFWQPASSLTWWAWPWICINGEYTDFACNVRSNVSSCLLQIFIAGNPGTFWLVSQICRSNSSKVVVGNGDLTCITQNRLSVQYGLFCHERSHRAFIGLLMHVITIESHDYAPPPFVHASIGQRWEGGLYVTFPCDDHY